MVEILENDDYFYDSLEDSTTENSDESIRNIQTISHSFNGSSKNEEEDDISTIVPLYSGDTNKKNVETRMSLNSYNEGCHSRSSKLNELRKRFFKGAEEKRKQKSYLSLFYSRIGYPSGDHRRNSSDTSRGVQGDSSFRSCTSYDSQDNELFQDAQDEEIDSESFYMNHIANEKRNNHSANKSLGFSQSMTTTSLTTTEISALRSVSEQVLDRFSTGSTKKPRHKRTLLKTPILGSLGPDMEVVKQKQLEWKRRVAYGQRVSEKNRIKIIENKILKELKSEIQSAHTVGDLTANNFLE